MSRRFSHVLAILTACSTMLAGMPIRASGATGSPGPGICFSASACDAVDPSDPRAESTREAEETETQQEDVDTKIDLFAEIAVPRRLRACLLGAINLPARPGERDGCSQLPAIRGPPARS
jgi:hypothetical protein